MIRIFLVDDHPVSRRNLRALLITEPQFLVVGEAADGQELLTQLPVVPTDVVLLDLNMPVLDGLATTHALQTRFPHVRILVLSMLDHEYSISQVLRAGAHGYVFKDSDKLELFTGIRTVASGRPFLCSEVGLKMLHQVAEFHAQKEKLTEKKAVLSLRERQVLQLIAEGMTNQQIADKLFNSKRTIETHRQNMLQKTRLSNTAALIKYAMDHNLLVGL